MTAIAIASPWCDTKIRTEADEGEREQIAAGLEALAAEVRTNPLLPVSAYGVHIAYGPRDGAAGVRRHAEDLGVQARDYPAACKATVRFGDAVSYVLLAARTEAAK